MSRKEELDSNELQFSWGKKRGIGGAKKDIRFYESFTFDGVEYSLYDCAYLFKKGESEPYIGKIVKIWEQSDGKKKVKLLWFFRPNEILHYLGDNEPSEKEIFLASGEGVGASNINPLEAIAGKCCVICTSKDERNAQPPKEALETADYIFFRTFDVGNFTLSETLADKIAGIEVKYLLNRDEWLKPNSVLKLEPNGIDGKDKAAASSVLGSSAKSEPLRLPEISAKDEKHDEQPASVSKSDADKGNLGNGVNHLSDEKNVPKLKSDSKTNEIAKKEAVVSRAEEDPKSLKKKVRLSTPDDKPSKKIKLSDDLVRKTDGLPTKTEAGSRKLRIDSDDDSGEDSLPLRETAEQVKPRQKKTLGAAVDSGTKVEKPKVVDSETKVEKLKVEMTRMPDADRKKWFRTAPWDGRLKNADLKGTLVFLGNLDPQCTSEEIEDIIYHAFNENCSAKVIQRGTFQNPNYGQAYVIFRSEEAANLAVQQINMGCIAVEDRQLVASRGILKIPPKATAHIGHLTVNKLKLQNHEEWKKAVATSHCSQPNTIEYEMAMDWMLVQEKSSCWLDRLHQLHGESRTEFLKKLKTK